MDASALPQWHAAQLPAELVAIAARLPHQRRPIILALLGEITHGRIAQHKHRASPRHRNLSSAWVATALEKGGEGSVTWLPLRYHSMRDAVVLNIDRGDFIDPDRVVVHLVVNERSGLSVVPVFEAHGLVWDGTDRLNKSMWEGPGGLRWNLAADDACSSADLMLECPYDDTCAEALLLQVLQSGEPVGTWTAVFFEDDDDSEGLLIVD